MGLRFRLPFRFPGLTFGWFRAPCVRENHRSSVQYCFGDGQMLCGSVDKVYPREKVPDRNVSAVEVKKPKCECCGGHVIKELREANKALFIEKSV